MFLRSFQGDLPKIYDFKPDGLFNVSLNFNVLNISPMQKRDKILKLHILRTEETDLQK